MISSPCGFLLPPLTAASYCRTLFRQSLPIVSRGYLSPKYLFCVIKTAIATHILYFTKEQVRTAEQQSNMHLDESQKYFTKAVTARREAQEIEEHARKILHTVENYGAVAAEVNQKSQKSIQEASELTNFHQSRIDYATSISQSLSSSYNSSQSLVALARKVQNHAKEENEVSYSLLSLMSKTKLF